MRNWITQIQINAIIALIILGVITWRIIDVILVNKLDPHDSQILGAALISCVGGIVYVCKLFASAKDD